MTALAYFFAGILFSNGIPHLTNGISGRTFPKRFPFKTVEAPETWFERWFFTPIANVIWGMLNFFIGYLLITHVGTFSIAHTNDLVSVSIGFVACSIFLAWNFGRVHAEEK